MYFLFAMINVHNIEDINIVGEGTIVTVGMFDGVHLGHRHLLCRLNELAEANRLKPVVVTFNCHPRQVLDDGYVPQMLCTRAERLSRLEECGVSDVAMVTFDKNTASLSACSFALQYLCRRLNMKGLLLGYDNMFGSRRDNDFDQLPQFAAQHGFKIFRDSAVVVDGIEVSSTKIRQSLLNGDLKTATAMLGGYYSIEGTVVHGRHVGSGLGFPTANVSIDDPSKLQPKSGVYAIMVEVEGRSYAAMANHGAQPTFHLDKPVLEVHLLDFDGELYDKKVRVHFLSRLRDIQAFPSQDALVEQLRCDRLEVERIINEQK